MILPYILGRMIDTGGLAHQARQLFMSQAVSNSFPCLSCIRLRQLPSLAAHTFEFYLGGSSIMVCDRN